MRAKVVLSSLVVILLITVISNIAVFASSNDEFPIRPVSIILPWNPGGAADLITRLLKSQWEKHLGQNMIIDNRPGAAGQVSWTTFLNQEQDGYTITAIAQPHMTITILAGGAQYSPDDFYCFTVHQEDPPVVNVLNDSPLNDMVDLVEYIKENPGKFSIGATGNSGPILLMNIMKEELDLDFTIVPTDDGRTYLLGGHLDAHFGDTFSNYPIRDQVKALGVGGNKPSELWPGVKTINEQLEPIYGVTVPNIAYVFGYGVSTEFKEKYPERLQKLVDAYTAAKKEPEYIEAATPTGQIAVLVDYSPEESNKRYHELFEITKQYFHYLEN